MDLSAMSCSPPFSFATLDETIEAQTSGTDAQDQAIPRKRRHSHFIPRRKSLVHSIMDGEEGLLLKVGCPD
jgi:adiponectin receptor